MAPGCPSFSNKNIFKDMYKRFRKWMKTPVFPSVIRSRDWQVPVKHVHTGQPVEPDELTGLVVTTALGIRHVGGRPAGQYHSHPAEAHLEKANEAIERAKYSPNYNTDLLLDHLNGAAGAIENALELLRYGNISSAAEKKEVDPSLSVTEHKRNQISHWKSRRQIWK